MCRRHVEEVQKNYRGVGEEWKNGAQSGVHNGFSYSATSESEKHRIKQGFGLINIVDLTVNALTVNVRLLGITRDGACAKNLTNFRDSCFFHSWKHEGKPKARDNRICQKAGTRAI